MTSTLPLRDRKKAKLRQALADASLRLFLKKGYNATTLEDICAECDVTVPTLLRYFASKEDLLFARQAAILEKCEKDLTEAAAENEVIDTWIHFIRFNAERVATSTEVLNMYKIIVDAPNLLGAFYAIMRRYEEILYIALSKERGIVSGVDLHSKLLAHLLVVGPVEESLRAIAEGDNASMVRRAASVMNYILDNFKRAEAGNPSARGSYGKRGAAAAD
jgi:AcrR family transcriptional regulator